MKHQKSQKNKRANKNKKSRKFGGATPEKNLRDTNKLLDALNTQAHQHLDGRRRTVISDNESENIIPRIRELALRIDPGYQKTHEEGIEEYGQGPQELPERLHYTTLEKLIRAIKDYPDIKLIEDLVNKEGQVFRKKTIIQAIRGFQYFDKDIDGVTEDKDIKTRIHKIMEKIVTSANLTPEDKTEIFREAIKFYNTDVIEILNEGGFFTQFPRLREFGYTNTGQPAYRGESQQLITRRNIEEKNVIDLLQAIHEMAEFMYIFESRGGLDADTYHGVFKHLRNAKR